MAGPETRVADGPWAGRRLADLASTYGAAFVGTSPYARYGARMPFLVKLLDAGAPLSVQVHPDDAYARRVAGKDDDLGKTEAWWVLEAAADALVWWGFAHLVARSEVEGAIADGSLVGLLRRLEVTRDDVVVNPAGTVHALGGGVFAYEVQQASDLTYRLFDHGRVGADGRPRELHVARGLDVATLTPGAAVAPTARAGAAGRDELARTHAFVLERVNAEAGASWSVGAGSLEVVTHVRGGPVVLRARVGTARLGRGESVLLPAGSGPVDVVGRALLARAWYPTDPA